MNSRSFSLFVTVACAALSTCAPIVGSPLDLVPGNVAGQTTPTVPTDLTGLIPGVPDLPNLSSVPGLPGLPSLPTIPGVPRQEVGDVVDPESLVSSIPSGLLGSLVRRQLEALGSGEELVDDVDGLTGVVPVAHPIPRDVEHPSLPEIFQDLAVKITPVADKIKAAVSVKAEINVDVVVGLLHDLIDILSEAVDEIQYIVDHPTEFVLSVAGTILSIQQVAIIVATLLSIVLPLLATVVGAVGTVESVVGGVVLPLVGTIGSLVASLLGLALNLVPGLLAALLPLISSLISTVYYLNLAEVVAILGLPALA